MQVATKYKNTVKLAYKHCKSSYCALNYGITDIFITATVLYTDPRAEPSASGTANGGEHIGQYGVPAAYERSFKWKVGYFRNLCAVSERPDA